MVTPTLSLTLNEALSDPGPPHAKMAEEIRKIARD